MTLKKTLFFRSSIPTVRTAAQWTFLLSSLLLTGCPIPSSPFSGKALRPAPVNLDPGPQYASDHRHWQGIPGIEVTPLGRLWACWYSGGTINPKTKNGEGPDNYVLLVTSTDGGSSWSSPLLVIDPPGPVRAFDPVLWLDPAGKLWLFWAQSFQWFDGRAGVWAIVAENPDSDKPAWSSPRRISNGIMMNKPTVLSRGEWLLPIAIWDRDESRQALKSGIIQKHEIRSNVYRSDDNGETFSLYSGADIPDRQFDEHMIVENKDSLWMLVRTTYGIGESSSTDNGRTWSLGTPSNIAHPASRFFIRRLASGKLLLVKHGDIREKIGRTKLTAFLSDDDGKTWQGGLLLDPRDISYPDGAQAKDGMIYVIYDHSRMEEKEILMAKFREEDILAKKCVTPGAHLQMRIDKAPPLPAKLN